MSTETIHAQHVHVGYQIKGLGKIRKIETCRCEPFNIHLHGNASWCISRNQTVTLEKE